MSFTTRLAATTLRRGTRRHHSDGSSATTAAGRSGSRSHEPSRLDHTVAGRVTVANLSSFTLTMVGFDGADRRDKLPRLGTVMAPGQDIWFKVAPFFVLPYHEVGVRFDVVDPAGRVLPYPYDLTISAERVRASRKSDGFDRDLHAVYMTRDHLVLTDAVKVVTPQVSDSQLLTVAV
jgi:hypothetical protein